MNLLRLTPETAPLAAPAVATIGFFDGVHLGHRHLIKSVVDSAKEMGLQSAVVTFDRHPRQVVQTDYVPQLLTTLDEKLQLLCDTGVDLAVVLPFDRQMASLSAHDFMRDVLKKQLCVERLVIGYDNRFGHGRTDGFPEYVDYGRELGIEVVGHEAYLPDGLRVSSSAVRRALADGNVKEACQMLGRAYQISGKIVAGFQEGRKMGFPTANLSLKGNTCLLPKNGVYAVGVAIDGESTAHMGMTNIGLRPTFGGQQLTCETHLLDFQGDLYGHTLCLSFFERIRGERLFDGERALAQQLSMDEQAVRQLFSTR